MKKNIESPICVQVAQYPEPLFLTTEYRKIIDLRNFRDSILHELDITTSLDQEKLFKKSIIFIKVGFCLKQFFQFFKVEWRSSRKEAAWMRTVVSSNSFGQCGCHQCHCTGQQRTDCPANTTKFKWFRWSDQPVVHAKFFSMWKPQLSSLSQKCKFTKATLFQRNFKLA